ncbi:MAG: hypothetical protein SPL13_04415 [Clostridia bacterium]|nr:hypothetical protein [Clostridia bacterium]
MAKEKSGKFYLIYGIAVIVIAVAFMLLNLFLFPKFLFHPILNSVALAATLFSLTAYIKAIKSKAPVFFMLGGILIGLVVLYVLLATMIELWWVAVVCTVAVWLITGLVSYVIAGNQTEAIALNKNEEYKDYTVRNKEKYEKAEEEDKKAKEELPSLKSFKE